MSKKIEEMIFSHAGTNFVISDLEYAGKERQNLTYTAFLQYYDNLVQIKISRWKNSRYDEKTKTHIGYICTSIVVIKILKGAFEEDLYGFLKFLEYCFDFEIIDIVEKKLIWRVTKNE